MSTDANTANSQAVTEEAGAPATPRERTQESAQPKRPNRLTRLLGQAGEPLFLTGDITRLGVRVFWEAIRKPYGYWGETRDQCFNALKLCWFPMFMSTFAFGFGAPGLTGGAIFHIFGIPSRLGSFFQFATIREFAPFVNGMVMAGVIGTAITADLGARRIREELDAMEVLGVDPIRTLVVPRVLAMTFMTAILDVMAVFAGLGSGYIAAGPVYGGNSAAFTASLFDLLNVPDVVGSIAKSAIFGLVIGVVCSYMGFHVKGGSIGVGRAVNQAVVIAFAGVWVVNFIFTSMLLGLSPSLYVFK